MLVSQISILKENTVNCTGFSKFFISSLECGRNSTSTYIIQFNEIH